jgi:hypothetical protein
MNDWLHNLPVPWMALVVFAFTYLFAGALYALVGVLAVGERARSFKMISPGMLPPLGIIFGLFVAFTAAQVWSDNERAGAAVSREASALRSVEILATSFPDETQAQLRSLIRQYIAEAANQEWPIMAKRLGTLRTTPSALGDALHLIVGLPDGGEGQRTARREMIISLDNALDARRQRMLISLSEVNFVKWLCLYLQAGCALVAIAMVHCDNRLASAISTGIFATGIAASALLIIAHDRPFTGQISVSPEPLLQVMPER